MSFEQGVLVRNGKVVGGISPDVLPLIGNVETVGTASKNDYSANTGLFINSLDQQLYVVISDISTGDILSPYPSGGENSNCVPASGYNIIEMIGELNADKLGDFNTTSDVTISGVTYHTYWEVAPTASNQVFGVAVHPTNGKLTRIYNNKGTYSAVSYDANTTTGDGIKTKVAKTGTAQSAISPTISASTTLDNAIGTLLNNDATLNADIPQLVGSVVGNGVKTYNQLLGELYTAYVSSGKTFKANSYLELQNGNYVPTTGNGSFISFYVNNAQMSTSQIYIGSSPTFYMMTCTTGGNTISDIGSTVASSGYTIKLYV